MAVSRTCCTAGPRRLRRPSAGGKVHVLRLEERLPPLDAVEGEAVDASTARARFTLRGHTITTTLFSDTDSRLARVRQLQEGIG